MIHEVIELILMIPTNDSPIWVVGWREPTDRRIADGDRKLAFRRLPDNKHRRFRVGNVLLLAEERDRPQQRTGAICRALQLAARMSAGPWPPSDSVRARLYVSLSRGKGRDREVT